MPAEFYRFALGAVVLGDWTSGSVRRVAVGIDFLPAPVRHEAIEANDERSAGGLRVTLPVDHTTTNAVVDLYRGTVPTGVVTLSLYRVHQGQVPSARIFFGDVASAEFSGAYCILTVEPKQGAFKQRVLRQLYQSPCNNTLYDAFCGVVRAGFSAAGTVSAIATDNITLTVAEAALQADDYYTGGQLAFGSRWGFITAHTGTTLVLLRPVPGLIATSAVTISAGCDRQIGTCETKFNNLANHMGFPLIPSRDPFTAGVGDTAP
jgi:uncharacterized phage protein (TIGR02218 family)